MIASLAAVPEVSVTAIAGVGNGLTVIVWLMIESQPLAFVTVTV